MNRVYVQGVEVFNKTVTIITDENGVVSVTVTPNDDSQGNSGGGPGEEN